MATKMTLTDGRDDNVCLHLSLLTSSHHKILSLDKVVTTDISMNTSAKWLVGNTEKCAGRRI